MNSQATAYTPDHPQVTLYTPGGQACEVDELMAPLLEALWARSIHTFYSCQGDRPTRRRASFEDRAYVLCQDSPALQDFIDQLRRGHGGFARAYVHHWTGSNLISRRMQRTPYGVETDNFQDDALRTCLRFHAGAIPALTAHALER